MPEALFVNLCIVITFTFFRAFTFLDGQRRDPRSALLWRLLLTIGGALALEHFSIAFQGEQISLSLAPIAALAFSNGFLFALLAAIPVALYQVFQGNPSLLVNELSLFLTLALAGIIQHIRKDTAPPSLPEAVRNSVVLFALTSLPTIAAALLQGHDTTQGLLSYLAHVIGSAGALSLITVVMRAHLRLLRRSEGYRALADLDPLTQLHNRRKFDADLNRSSPPGYVLLLDLDHFKRINDTYGHAKGDAVLQATARELRKAVRQTDGVYRLGGEEFAVLLAACSAEHVADVAERIRRGIQENVAQAAELPAETITISGGLISFQTDSARALREADELLYSAKTNGRNQIAGILSTAS